MSRQSHSATPVIDISENSFTTRPLSDSDKPPNTRPSSDGSKPKWIKGSPVAPPALELILLGKTSSGISATGNAIVKHDKFKSSPVGQKDAHQCEKCSSAVWKRKVVVVDTPGLYRAGKDLDDTIRKIKSYIASNGLNQALYLVVIQMFDDIPFTKEDETVLDIVSEIVGNGADSRFIVIFTYFGKSDANQNIKKYLEKPKLRQFVEKCNNRYVLFQFHGGKIKTQAVEKLFSIVDIVYKSPKQHDDLSVQDISDNEIDRQETKVRNCIEPNDNQLSEVQKRLDGLTNAYKDLSMNYENLRKEQEKQYKKTDIEIAKLHAKIQSENTRFVEFEMKCSAKMSEYTSLIVEQKTALNEKYPNKQHLDEDETKHLVMNEKDIKKNDDRNCVIL